MKKMIAIGLSTALFLGFTAGCSKKDESGNPVKAKEKVLVMGTSADYAPFEYIDTANGDEIIGFDPDIAKAIGEKLGYEIKIKDIDFASLLLELNSNKVDFVMASMTVNDERKEKADFTDVYYEAKNLIVTKKDSGITSLNDLKGKIVGVQTGSIQADAAEELTKKYKFKKTENRNRIPDVVQELKAGRFDAIVMEDTVAAGYLKKLPEFSSFLVPENGKDNGFAIAFPKDSKLTAEFNKEIKKMKDNGELETLIKKWFDQ